MNRRALLLFFIVLLCAPVFSSYLSREEYKPFLDERYHFHEFEEGENFAVIVCGSHPVSPFGHSAILLNGTIYSYDNHGLRVFENASDFVINYLVDGRQVVFLEIAISSEQKVKIYNFLENFQDPGYNYLFYNCTNVVFHCLVRASIMVPGEVGSLVTPNELERVLEAKGIVSRKTIIWPVEAIYASEVELRKELSQGLNESDFVPPPNSIENYYFRFNPLVEKRLSVEIMPVFDASAEPVPLSKVYETILGENPYSGRQFFWLEEVETSTRPSARIVLLKSGEKAIRFNYLKKGIPYRANFDFSPFYRFYSEEWIIQEDGRIKTT